MARKRRNNKVRKSPVKQTDKNESIPNGTTTEREESSGESPDGGDSATESNNSGVPPGSGTGETVNSHKKFGKYRILQRSNSSSQEDISETESYSTQKLLPRDIQQIVVGDVSAEITITQDEDEDEDVCQSRVTIQEEDDTDADPCLGEDEVVYEEVIENTIMSDEEAPSYEHHMENSVDIPFSQEVTVGEGNSCSDSNQFTSFAEEIKKTILNDPVPPGPKDSCSSADNKAIDNINDTKGSEIKVFSEIESKPDKPKCVPEVENNNPVSKMDTLENVPSREESCENNVKSPTKVQVAEIRKSPPPAVDVQPKSTGRTKSDLRRERVTRFSNANEVSTKQEKGESPFKVIVHPLIDPRLAAREAAVERKKLTEKQVTTPEKQNANSRKIVSSANSPVAPNSTSKTDLNLGPLACNTDCSEGDKLLVKNVSRPNEETISQTQVAVVKPSVMNTPTTDIVMSSMGFESDKPVKVKSRWRRSSELEMGNSNSNNSITNSVNNSLDQVPNRGGGILSSVLQTSQPPSVVVRDPEIEARLKSFEPIVTNQFLTERSRSKEAKRMVCDCSLTKEEIARNEKGCGDDCLNRLLMIECGSRCTLGDLCSNKRFQNCEYTKCEVIKTAKKGFGLKCLETVPSGHFLMEYVGEVIDPREFKRRAKEYAKDKNRHYYFMALKADTIIDATHRGNISRFINHSCEPNAETQKWTVNGELRIGFFSKRPISLGDEITFDYQLQRYGKEAQRCYCESRNCRGWIGEDPEKEKERDRKEWANRKEQRKEKKRKEEKRRDFKEYLNDMDLEEEVEKLFLSGVKNQAHTLTLCRLMVRAEDHKCRSRLMDITKKGDTRCLRLFLDYHGLALLWSWMMDNLLSNKLKLQILDTLYALPIQNKTMIKDSKVLSIVEKWVKPKNDALPVHERKERSSTEDENSVSPNENCTVESKPPGEESGSVAVSETETDSEKKIEEGIGDQDGTGTETLADNSDRPLNEEELLVLEKAKKLLQKWSTLKEEFRIPKKQRIEQMKEHEREADMGYNSDPRDSQSYDRHRSYDKDGSRFREKEKKKRESPDVDWTTKKMQRADDRNANSISRLPKAQRRQLFAMKVEEEERQRKQMEEMWQKHQEQCAALGVDPTQTAMFNPQTGFPSYYHPANGTWNPFPPPHSDGNMNCEGMDGKQPMGGGMYPTNQPPPNMGMPMNMYQARPMMRPPFMEQGVVPPFGGGGGPPPGCPPMFMDQGQFQSGPPPGGPFPVYQAPPRPPYPPSPYSGPGGPPFVPPPQQAPPPMMGPPPPLYQPMLPPQQQPAGPLPQMMRPPPPILPQQPPQSQPPPQPQPQAQPQPQPIAQPQPQMVPAQLTPPLPHGPPPPPPVVLKLPPKWKSAKDKEGRTYYYHVKTRKSQWQFPVFDPNDASESSSESSESSDIDDSSSDDDEDKVQDEDEEEEQEEELTGEAVGAGASAVVAMETENNLEGAVGEQTNPPPAIPPAVQKQELQKDKESTQEVQEPVLKKRREGLVQVAIISPRDDDYYGKGISKSKVRDAKEKILRQKMKLKARARKRHANSTSAKCEADTSSGPKRKIKDMFRINMANVVVAHLNAYRKPDCKVARITSTEDFKHLARKLTHFVMLKELRHCVKVEDLECNDNVKHKARDFINKYMSKFGAVYQRPLED